MSKYLPREHWNRQHGRTRKAKQPFDSVQQAQQYLREHGITESYRAYKCSVCGKYHIGHRHYNKSNEV